MRGQISASNITSPLKALKITALAAMLAFATPALAETNLGSFTDWTAWEDSDPSGKICYISAEPSDWTPRNVNRDPIHFLVTHQKGTKVHNEVSTIIGYPFDATITATATIDGKSYEMITDKSHGWLAVEANNVPFVSAMKAGAELIVVGTSKRGTRTTDTYSLKGVTAAMAKIDSACK